MNTQETRHILHQFCISRLGDFYCYELVLAGEHFVLASHEKYSKVQFDALVDIAEADARAFLCRKDNKSRNKETRINGLGAVLEPKSPVDYMMTEICVHVVYFLCKKGFRRVEPLFTAEKN